MKTNGIVTVMAIVLLNAPMIVWAKPEITLTTVTEKEVVSDQNGNKVKRRVTAESVSPGQVLFFTLNYTNKGDEKAVNVVVNNPIPDGTVYVNDSAKGKGSDITFSIDQGKTFKKASLLTYEFAEASGKKKKLKASPEQYTHVRWVIKEVPPGASGSLSFQVRVK